MTPIARRSASLASLIDAVAESDTREARYELYVRRAVDIASAYAAVFGSLARELGVYIVAGALTVPPMDDSPHTGGWRVLGDHVLHNVSPLFGPRGWRIGRTAKVRIPPCVDRFSDPGGLEALYPAETRLGRIGTTLCFDGYHHGPLERVDAQGTTIVAQPIHFADPNIRYAGTAGFVPAHEDFGRMLQGRGNIRLAARPPSMLQTPCWRPLGIPSPRDRQCTPRGMKRRSSRAGTRSRLSAGSAQHAVQ